MGNVVPMIDVNVVPDFYGIGGWGSAALTCAVSILWLQNRGLALASFSTVCVATTRLKLKANNLTADWLAVTTYRI